MSEPNANKPPETRNACSKCSHLSKLHAIALACQIVDQPRSSQRYEPQVPDDEPRLIAHMLQLVREFPRYGYRLVTHKLRQQGWTVNAKRVYRLWRREGLKVPKKQRKTRHSGQHKTVAIIIGRIILMMCGPGTSCSIGLRMARCLSGL